MMNDNKGFTLIELLVTIAIIAILASLLLPALTRARNKAHQAKCIINLKNLAIAIHHYSIDFNETFPSTGPSAGGKESLALLFTSGYMNNEGIFICPSGNGTSALDSDYRYAPNLRESSDSDSPLACDDSTTYHPIPRSVNVVYIAGNVQMRSDFPTGVSAPIE